MDNKHNSLHLGQKYSRIFVLRQYLFLEAHSMPSSNALASVRFSEQIMSADKYSSIFWCQMEAIVYISLCIRFFSFSFSASDDCEECGNYVRHIFSIVPGSLAIICLLIVLLFQHSHMTWRKNGKTVLTTCADDYLLNTLQLPLKQLIGLTVLYRYSLLRTVLSCKHMNYEEDLPFVMMSKMH